MSNSETGVGIFRTMGPEPACEPLSDINVDNPSLSNEELSAQH